MRQYAEADQPAQRRLAVEIRLRLYQDAPAPELYDEILAAWEGQQKPAAGRSSALPEDRERPRRWWRRAKSNGRGQRALMENRLRELEAEEADLSQPFESIAEAASDRAVSRDSVGR